ncbi:SAM-dependent methyltransferase [Bdellovibrio sp. KM01]|uniref:class I SAM-dependent methyltransferase n=1 Tax=Bdellovibrio sp. KM01 TaxID=2748865 RepID=UPI0015EA5ADF|nr:SAM-dependent methyltransferase [Bdellovibrio sp. KM01]QLY25007.1 SAM-dependent methyltransferase [Bdellovibrio sp. KM01]
MKKPLEEMRDGQSIELLKELHILTRDGKINQDSRRKLKQVYHLYNFIEPLLKDLQASGDDVTLVDHGAGKSYLGFIIYDLFFKNLASKGHVYGIETRDELVKKSVELQGKLDFPNMSFLPLLVAEATESKLLPEKIGLVTALHACDTATDDAIDFALKKQAKHIVLVPCCQAEMAKVLRQNKAKQLASPLTEVWRHPIHTREFGSHLTNVLRSLRLEAHGYQVTVTELVGFEHSMKNELIIATKKEGPRQRAADRLNWILEELNLKEMAMRFSTATSSK